MCRRPRRLRVRSGVGQPGGVEKKLNDAVTGVNTLADSSRQLALGVQTLVDQTRNLGAGLDQASSFLLAMKREAADPPMSGFYIPPQVLTMDEFKKAAALFVSEDGHSARYLIQTALNPFSIAAMDQTKVIVDTANASRPNTQLAGAEISMVGYSSINANIRDFYDADFVYILLMTLVVVFLILFVLLRSLVAPLYLVLSVILSYGAALGIGVVLFQFILGQELSWGVPGIAFMVLVAVGADYNLLLISRIRDEAKYGVRSAVIRTVGATGGVITSAGLIFAASMMALTVSSVLTAAQIGFVIGVGLLLDTFLVRTLTVPAAAVLIGDANWWPSKPPRVKLAAARLAAATAAASRCGARGGAGRRIRRAGRRIRRGGRRGRASYRLAPRSRIAAAGSQGTARAAQLTRLSATASSSRYRVFTGCGVPQRRDHLAQPVDTEHIELGIVFEPHGVYRGVVREVDLHRRAEPVDGEPGQPGVVLQANKLGALGIWDLVAHRMSGQDSLAAGDGERSLALPVGLANLAGLPAAEAVVDVDAAGNTLTARRTRRQQAQPGPQQCQRVVAISHLRHGDSR